MYYPRWWKYRSAVANYNKFEKLGFKLESIFDINPKLVGLK